MAFKNALKTVETVVETEDDTVIVDMDKKVHIGITIEGPSVDQVDFIGWIEALKHGEDSHEFNITSASVQLYYTEKKKK